ncbi:MAG: ABC transporter substrate-binding protein [Sphingomonadales bacterium 28-55-16]|nr:MAG: ABC transporter substrate-binding protein [Sphingomonadales bacterium 28-55-16]
MRKFSHTASLALVLAASLAGCSGGTKKESLVDKIKARDQLICSGSQGIPGLSRPDEKGVWRGFDSDVCRAIAVAILGDAQKVRFVPLNAAQRLPAVQTGEIDILSRTSTLTFTRDMAIRFVATTLYDGDVVITRKAENIDEPKKLAGRTICMQGGGSLVEGALDELEAANDFKMKRVYFDSTITARDTYFAGRCDAYVTDGLAAQGNIATVAENPAEHTTMYAGDAIEPNGIAIRRGDDKLFDVARWTFNVLIWAEKNEITQANVDDKAKNGDEVTKRILGGDPSFGRSMGLDPKWAYNVIKQVGNYGEIWDRNLGEKTPIKADRRFNKLYTNGGLMFPLPWD